MWKYERKVVGINLRFFYVLNVVCSLKMKSYFNTCMIFYSYMMNRFAVSCVKLFNNK